MPYIKKLVMKGFKSFASETEIPLENSMNVIVGPNGSGKSNISDAICFVLGRLSAKSMRAEKSANLIFAGTKLHKPAHEASVRLVFNNSDKTFLIESKEVDIERILRHNGQSIYKINSEVKTRQEVLELLSTASIDPNGYNIILQGEIQGTVKMRGEERRQVIEEVAGMSVYEARKEKSLHELEKTDEKLKEVSATLRERTIYLKNLENERQQALKFKQLQEQEKRCKATILHKQIEEKKKEAGKITEEIEKFSKSREKLKLKIQETQSEIGFIEQKINDINLRIQKSTGIEQETLFSELTQLRESLAGLTVHKDNSKRKLEEVIARRERAEESIKELENLISELKKKFPMQARKQEELEKKRKEVEELEKNKRKFFSIKQELLALKQRIEDKKSQILKNKNEVDFVLKEISSLELKFKSTREAKENLKKQQNEYEKIQKKISESENKIISLEKNISVAEAEIKNFQEIKKQVSKIDICPLCKSKITKEHINHVFSDCDAKIFSFSKSLENSKKELSELNLPSLKSSAENLKHQVSLTEIEIVKLESIEQRTEFIKRLDSQKKSLEQEAEELSSQKEKLEEMQEKFKYSEERYEQTLLEIEQISARTEKNINLELEMKNRELDSTKLIIKQSARDEEDLKEEIKEKEQEIDEKTLLLEEKEKAEKKLKEKFNKLFEERTSLQKEIQNLNSELISRQHESQLLDNQINEIKIDKARIDAEHETLGIDFQDYVGVELIQGSIEILKEKLQKAEDSLRIIGSVNLRALEVYDGIKKEYDSIAEKTSQLEKEKLEILKIIDEIDTKKKRTFMKTLASINELFTRNFMQLSSKGEAFLELENKEDPFAAGLDISIRVGKGKYFDVTSLSGGEQTLVALSLIFAIQEYKPYCFYIFDEVDAALDKRNSERLAVLIKKYMRTGQYIIITHNDAIITESSLLYGVTMQEGISKILSMQV